MSGKYYVGKGSEGLENLANKLAKINAGSIQKLVVETTLKGHEELVDKITNDVWPHSGEHRKRNPQPVVTDLVDTGFYRSSWNSSFPSQFRGEVLSNAKYAAPLEYGTEHMAGFFVVRDTARKMQGIFKYKAEKLIKESLQ